MGSDCSTVRERFTMLGGPFFYPGVSTWSRWLRRNVEDDGDRSLVEESLDEFHERVRILKACTGIEAGGPEELPVALHVPIYPPRPHFLTLSPASDFHSGHAGPFFPFV